MSFGLFIAMDYLFIYLYLLIESKPPIGPAYPFVLVDPTSLIKILPLVYDGCVYALVSMDHSEQSSRLSSLLPSFLLQAHCNLGAKLR